MTPIREEVKAFCEVLGLDPLYLANEGKIVVIVPPIRPKPRWLPCGEIHWVWMPPVSAGSPRTRIAAS